MRMEVIQTNATPEEEEEGDGDENDDDDGDGGDGREGGDQSGEDGIDAYVYIDMKWEDGGLVVMMTLKKMSWY